MIDSLINTLVDGIRDNPNYQQYFLGGYFTLLSLSGYGGYKVASRIHNNIYNEWKELKEWKEKR